MIKNYSYLLVVAIFLMSGCAKEEEKTTPVKAEDLPVFSEQIQALEKAKKLEQDFEMKIDKSRQAIEEALNES